MAQNLSELAEREGEEDERSTEQKYWYDNVLFTSKEKWREVEAMLAQMHSEHEIECQHWGAERSMEHMQWENDNCLWDEKCVKLKAQRQQGAQEKLELTN